MRMIDSREIHDLSVLAWTIFEWDLNRDGAI